jgi:hypothetical protein
MDTVPNLLLFLKFFFSWRHYVFPTKYIIIITILLQLGVHPVAVELTQIQTRKVYNIREQYKTKLIQKTRYTQCKSKHMKL